MSDLNPAWLEIEQGLIIEISETGSWLLRSGEKQFRLSEMSDFYRAWLLLERPFPEVKAALDLVAKQGCATEVFPFAKLIGSALKANSSQWTDHAMAWVPFINAVERASLRKLFVEMIDSKWASQKSRQLARKYANQIACDD